MTPGRSPVQRHRVLRGEVCTEDVGKVLSVLAAILVHVVVLPDDPHVTVKQSPLTEHGPRRDVEHRDRSENDG